MNKNITVISRSTDVNNTEMYEQMIKTEEDLNNIDFYCAPGSIAFIAGFSRIWHMDAEGNWIEFA